MTKCDVILVDMDEVLSDFVGGALSVHGYRDDPRAPGTWNLAASMRITIDEFWNPITAKGEEFWTSLNPTPWFYDLVDMLTSGSTPWYIVTAPSRCPTSYSGKVKWLRSKFGETFDRFFITPHKEILASPSRILIDDKEYNLDRFRSSGGQGVLFPTLGGPLWDLRADPLSHVKERLNALGIQ